jgi:hypothetical protein
VYRFGPGNQSAMTVAVQVYGVRSVLMNRTLLAAAAALALLNPLAAVAQAPVKADALPDLDAQVRCAALFALVVSEQNRKAPGADRFPPLEVIGKSFFISTGLRLIEERKMPPEQMQAFYMAQVSVIRTDHAKTADPARALDAEMAGCLKMAESVPPPPAG